MIISYYVLPRKSTMAVHIYLFNFRRGFVSHAVVLFDTIQSGNLGSRVISVNRIFIFDRNPKNVIPCDETERKHFHYQRKRKDFSAE